MFSGLASLIFPALMPALTDGLRGIFAKVTGGAGGTPQNVGERIQLMQAETARLQALADIDKPSGEPSRWVTDMRSSFRYIAILIIWLATIAAVFTPDIAQPITLMMLDLSGACMSFVIGERMYLSLKK
jgi:hypothetical protein